MAQRELDIIAEARITINDVNLDTQRWSDERLLHLLSDGQRDMCRNLPMVVKDYNVQTVGDVVEYKLPLDCVKLIYASSYIDDGSLVQTKTMQSLQIISYDTLNRDNPNWESDYSSDFYALVVNALSQNTIRPYPILAHDVAYSKAIKIKYQAIPEKLGFANGNTIDELVISSMWDYALTQYVIGMAFIDYGDASSLSRSQVALGLYAGQHKKAENLSKKSFAKRSVTTNYRAKVFNQNRRYNHGYRNTRH